MKQQLRNDKNKNWKIPSWNANPDDLWRGSSSLQEGQLPFHNLKISLQLS